MELAEKIAEMVVNTNFDHLDEKIVNEVKRRFLDSIGVALAAKESEPAKIIRTLFSYYNGNVLTFSGDLTGLEISTFYNSFLIRYLDFNDTYLSKEPLHPSDMLGGLISLGYYLDLKGKDLILAAAIGYDIGVRLCDSASLRSKGVDHVVFLGIAASAAMAKLLNLDYQKTLNAISLSLVPNIALRETRSGELSMWKGAAAANSVRNALFANLLSIKGFTGPKKPFSGKFGLINVILKGDIDLKPLINSKKPEGILKTHIKKYPVEYHAQAAVDVAKNLRYEGEIVKVIAETYEAAKNILADSEEKWRPKNRETADHSLPYILAVSLLKRDFWLESYNLIDDEKVLSLMKKIEVIEVPEYTRLYADELPIKLIVYTDRGRFENEVRIPRGHARNPMSDEELEEKFLRLTNRKDLINIIQKLEEIKVRDLVRSIVKV
jgi:2-methylcitrate dehydratase